MRIFVVVVVHNHFHNTKVSRDVLEAPDVSWRHNCRGRRRQILCVTQNDANQHFLWSQPYDRTQKTQQTENPFSTVGVNEVYRSPFIQRRLSFPQLSIPWKCHPLQELTNFSGRCPLNECCERTEPNRKLHLRERLHLSVSPLYWLILFGGGVLKQSELRRQGRC